MGADLIVNLPCDAKRALGGGDAFQGTLTMLRMRKSRGQAMAVAAQLQAAGIPLDQPVVTVVVETPEGSRERKVSVAELLADSAPLTEHEGGCAGCPANATNQPYGCLGYVTYPIEPSAEAWLIDRVQPLGSLGHHLLCSMLQDFGYTGEMFASWRERGLFTAPAPRRVVLLRAEDGELSIDSNQIFQAVFGVGERLNPTHCALVLLWLGGLAIDGVVAETMEPTPLRVIGTLTTTEQRSARSTLMLGSPSDDPAVASMQRMLLMLYVAWVNGVELLVDA